MQNGLASEGAFSYLPWRWPWFDICSPSTDSLVSTLIFYSVNCGIACRYVLTLSQTNGLNPDVCATSVLALAGLISVNQFLRSVEAHWLKRLHSSWQCQRIWSILRWISFSAKVSQWSVDCSRIDWNLGSLLELASCHVRCHTCPLSLLLITGSFVFSVWTLVKDWGIVNDQTSWLSCPTNPAELQKALGSPQSSRSHHAHSYDRLASMLRLPELSEPMVKRATWVKLTRQVNTARVQSCVLAEVGLSLKFKFGSKWRVSVFYRADPGVYISIHDFLYLLFCYL